MDITVPDHSLHSNATPRSYAECNEPFVKFLASATNPSVRVEGLGPREYIFVVMHNIDQLGYNALHLLDIAS
jgi:hypothetical protein